MTGVFSLGGRGVLQNYFKHTTMIGSDMINDYPLSFVESALYTPAKLI